MRTKLTLLAAGLGLLATGAQAQQLIGAGSLYGGPSQTRAVCYFDNLGTSSVGLSSPMIRDQNGSVIPLLINQCGSTLFPGRACGIATSAFGNTVYSCSATVTPNARFVRGIFEMRDVGQNTLQNVELR